MPRLLARPASPIRDRTDPRRNCGRCRRWSSPVARFIEDANGLLDGVGLAGSFLAVAQRGLSDMLNTHGEIGQTSTWWVGPMLAASPEDRGPRAPSLRTVTGVRCLARCSTTGLPKLWRRLPAHTALVNRLEGGGDLSGYLTGYLTVAGRLDRRLVPPVIDSAVDLRIDGTATTESI